MAAPRVIPVLLLRGGGLYKTTGFKDPRYVGDPINVLRIFNDKEVDEIAVLDIGATPDRTAIQFERIREIASECFMPLCYGGGITDLDDLQRVFGAGVEKVSVNTTAIEDPGLVEAAASRYGSQSVVVSIDVRPARRGHLEVCTRGGSVRTGFDPVAHAKNMEAHGAGELLVTSIDREGTSEGYDLDLVGEISTAVGIPVIANGGAGTIDHLARAVEVGAAAAAAGSMFVFYGRHRAVLISYPSAAERERVLG